MNNRFQHVLWYTIAYLYLNSNCAFVNSSPSPPPHHPHPLLNQKYFILKHKHSLPTRNYVPELDRNWPDAAWMGRILVQSMHFTAFLWDFYVLMYHSYHPKICRFNECHIICFALFSPISLREWCWSHVTLVCVDRHRQLAQGYHYRRDIATAKGLAVNTQRYICKRMHISLFLYIYGIQTWFKPCYLWKHSRLVTLYIISHRRNRPEHTHLYGHYHGCGWSVDGRSQGRGCYVIIMIFFWSNPHLQT